MEATEFLQELIARIALVGDYGNIQQSEPGEPLCAHIHLADAVVTIFVDERDGVPTGALSYLTATGHEGTHLNRWTAKGSTTTNALWQAFWKHEEENRTLGRVTWMHGSELPEIKRKPIPKPEPKVELSDLGGIFDLF